MTTYTQCLLRKPVTTGGIGYTQQTTWISSEYARMWTYIKLKIDGKWQDGWRVEGVYSTKDKDWVEDHEIDYRRQRKASDI